jgi:hypothetical protein
MEAFAAEGWHCIALDLRGFRAIRDRLESKGLAAGSNR